MSDWLIYFGIFFMGLGLGFLAGLRVCKEFLGNLMKTKEASKE